MTLRTRKPSFKEPAEPRIRPCANCGDEKMIVARGLCDKCRKQGERNEAKLVAGTGNRRKQLNGYKALAALEKLLNDMGVLRANRERMLQEFLPFCGFSPDTQRLLLRDMTAENAGDLDTTYGVHAGSSKAPIDSKIRTPLEPGRMDNCSVRPSTHEPQSRTAKAGNRLEDGWTDNV